MNTYEEKILMLCNELDDEIEERFYLLDREFDNTYCQYILYTIGKMFIEKNIFILYRNLMMRFIEKCFEKLSEKEIYDYTFLTDNLEYLVNELISIDDVDKIREEIDIYLDNKNSDSKKLLLSNIG